MGPKVDRAHIRCLANIHGIDLTIGKRPKTTMQLALELFGPGCPLAHALNPPHP